MLCAACAEKSCDHGLTDWRLLGYNFTTEVVHSRRPSADPKKLPPFPREFRPVHRWPACTPKSCFEPILALCAFPGIDPPTTRSCSLRPPTSPRIRPSIFVPRSLPQRGDCGNLSEYSQTKMHQYDVKELLECDAPIQCREVPTQNGLGGRSNSAPVLVLDVVLAPTRTYPRKHAQIQIQNSS